MPKIDPMTVATRFFNTPLLIEPRKAAVIATALGPRFLGLGSEAGVQIEAGNLPAATEGHARAARAGSLVADGLFHAVKDHGGYSVIEGVAIIPVVGSLVRRGSWVGQSSGATSYEGISAQLRAAIEDRTVRAIALEIDSFGGEAHGCFALAAEIRAARQVKPVEAFLAEFACSAGYMIAAQADRITIPEFGDAGSIGVVMMHADFEQQLENNGVRVTLIYSGAHKVDGNPYQALPKAVRDEWQADGDAMRVRFAQEVAEGRGNRLTMEAALRTEAQCYRGAAALRAGLADEVAEARAAFADYVARVAASARLTAPAKGGVVRGVEANLISATLVSASRLPADLVVSVQQPAAQASLTSLFNGALRPQPGATAPNQKESDMNERVDQPTAEARTATPAVASDTAGAAVTPTPQAAQADAAFVLERCERAGLGLAQAREMIAASLTREQVLERIVDAKADRAADGGEIRPAGHASVTGDARDRQREGMTRALLAKTNLAGGERNEFTSMSLREMARASLQAQGIVVRGGVMEFAGAVFAPAMASGGMHSTSDFANILVNVADKAMLKGFTESPEVFERFTSVGTMTDFKATKRVGLDEFPILEKVEEGAEFTYGTMGDHAETAMLATYGKLFAITRQTIINDDLDAFSRVPMKMGRAARRTIGDLVFAVLTGNPNMSDGVALFHGNHGNLASAAGVPSEASINAAITAMATQKDRSENAHALNIAPRFLIAPPKYRSAVLQALNSEYAPDDTAKAGTAKMSNAYNTVRNAAEPIFDPRLSGNAWFMAADPTVHDTIEVGYLDGNPAPFLEQQAGWSVDGTEFKVRIDACATALAYQTLFKNAGA